MSPGLLLLYLLVARDSPRGHRYKLEKRHWCSRLGDVSSHSSLVTQQSMCPLGEGARGTALSLSFQRGCPGVTSHQRSPNIFRRRIVPETVQDRKAPRRQPYKARWPRMCKMCHQDVKKKKNHDDDSAKELAVRTFHPGNVNFPALFTRNSCASLSHLTVVPGPKRGAERCCQSLGTCSRP